MAVRKPQAPGHEPAAYLRGALVGLPLAAAALWMVSTTTTGAPPAPAEHAPAAAAETAANPWFDLERQRARLEQLTAAPAVSPSRNPFRFGAPPPRPSQPPVPGRSDDERPALSGRPLAPVEAPVPVRLVGVAGRRTPDGPSRSAILSGLGQVFVAGAGDLVAGRYRVTAVGEDAAELRDETTGQIVRLALR
jgi:hypothetical protein